MVIYVALGTMLIAIIYFILIATGLALSLSPVAGVVTFLFWRLIDPEERGRTGLVRVIVTAVAGATVAVAVAWLVGVSGTPMWDATGVVLAGALAIALYSYRAQGREVACAICSLAAPRGAGFDCPRCGDRVCARPTCWNAKYYRCVRCHKREIVIFPIAEKWWAARLGRRVMTGECLSCYKEAQEADLRECGQCHWPMCKRCWDYHNGTCQRCEWTIPDLPGRLAALVKRPKRSRTPARPAAAAHRVEREPPRDADDTLPPVSAPRSVRPDRAARPRQR
jgi:hypothetical protein